VNLTCLTRHLPAPRGMHSAGRDPDLVTRAQSQRGTRLTAGPAGTGRSKAFEGRQELPAQAPLELVSLEHRGARLPGQLAGEQPVADRGSLLGRLSSLRFAAGAGGRTETRCLAVLIYGASVHANPQSFYQYARMGSAALKSVSLVRYGVVPSMMLCALIPLACATGLRFRRDTAARVAAFVLVLLLLVQFGPQDTRRSDGPAWQPQISALQPICKRLPGQALVAVKETLGWHVDIQCGRIE
jgi:hypothetical protein